MKFFLFIILVMSQLSCGPLNSPYNNTYSRGYSHNSSKAGMPTGPGCYAKCLMSDQFASHPIPIIEYTGDKYNDPNVESRRLIVKEASTKWVKKKADKNCLSSDPNDCLVWCLVESEEEVHDYYTVLDTTLTNEYINKEIEYKELISVGGFTEWKQVVCDLQISQKLLVDVNSALIERDYSLGDDVSTVKGFGPETKAALVKFQKDNSLPVGQLDFETLDLLGVDY